MAANMMIDIFYLRMEDLRGKDIFPMQSYLLSKLVIKKPYNRRTLCYSAGSLPRKGFNANPKTRITAII